MELDNSMLYDEAQQLETKEDLFAAISDTSLKSGKKMRQRRKPEPEPDDSEEDIPTKKQSYKSRTVSRERSKPQEESQLMDISEPPQAKPTSRQGRGRAKDTSESMDTSQPSKVEYFRVIISMGGNQNKYSFRSTLLGAKYFFKISKHRHE